MLDEVEAERIAADAFDGALEEFMGVAGAPDPDRVEMVAAYTPDRLRDMVRTAYSHLRSRGERHPRLDETLPPRPAGEAERLEAAASAALAELAVASGGGGGEGDRLHREARRRSRPGTRRRSARTPATSTATPRRRGPRSQVAEQEHRDHTMLRVLLELYDERYEAAKRERSGLDFEDLELVARDLLAGDEGLREAYASRFEHVLVDEFQDTNRLQNELLGLLSRDNLFRVGDENQSIYRFRNADVSVFREHWEEAREAGRAESITVNFRSRGEVLDAIDLAFERTWGEGFEPLREAPGSREPAAPVEPCVDLLVVDKGRDAWKEPAGQGDLVRRGAPRRAAVAGGGGAPACEAGRRAHARRPVVLRRRRDPVPRHHRDGALRARARRARHPRARGRAGAATGASSRSPTCATGWRRSRTRSTASRSSPCSPRRSRACRSTRSR